MGPINFFKFSAMTLILCLPLSSLNIFAGSLLVQSAPQAQDAKWLKIIHFVAPKNSSQQMLNMSNKIPERYIEQILSSLKNPKTLNDVLAKLFAGQNTSLSKSEEGVLLTLCIFEQSRQRQKIDPVTWAIIKDKVGSPKFMNLFLDENADDPKLTSYDFYSLDSNQLLFIQLLGRGAHNSGFLVWMIQKNGTKFMQIRLMKIKSLVSDKKFTHELIAQKISYDKNEKQLVVYTSDKDVENYNVDALHLVLMQKTN